ncbi:MAG TPA: dihydrodipicolinate synthase family protein [Xanthobacteraceae bacterium]|nr:dihydrodipicolinate synthase family protein [Xanthobacteraceae bacterium]
MARVRELQPAGVIPATLLAFHEDFSIDEAETRRHLAQVAATPGISAITVNGHSCEIHALTFDEQRRVLAVALAEIGHRLPLISGVYADGSLHAARIARMAQGEGASALLVFPPNSMAAGGQLRPEMALTHFRHVAEACDLPIILFQYPLSTGLGYPFDTLMRLLDEIPSIRAVKDWTAEPMLHEKHIRTLQARSRPVNVLTTQSSWLMSSLVMGANGLLSGAGSVLADLQVALFEAVAANDLGAAQRLNDRLYPLQQAFYAPPFLDMHNRMKECLVMLGRLQRAVVRPPLMKLSAAELARLRQALDAAGIHPDGALTEAAE